MERCSKNLSYREWLAVDGIPLFETLTDDEKYSVQWKKMKMKTSDKPDEEPSHSEAYSCLINQL
ncbi:hypothetical protein T4B_724 [Trichinella pseudospiralis]|nr:hypothetical protein T4A_3684 [Trichinella pseudospiralis]KRZ27814.1 hypothetical protein T4B_724 [Trichinella pseudospiralis]